MATFVDRVVLHLQAGDGGHGCVSIHREKFKPLRRAGRRQRRARRQRSAGRRPAACTRCSTSTSTRTSRPTTARAAPARTGTAANGHNLVLKVPDGTVVQTTDGDGAGRPGRRRHHLRGGPRRARRARQRVAGQRQAQGARLRRAGRARRPTRRRAGAEERRRRGPGGLPVRRQVVADLGDLRRQAEDRRLPVHHPRAQPRRGAGRTTTPSPSRTCRADPRRGHRQGPGPGVPAAHRALRGAGARHRLGDAGDRAATRWPTSTRSRPS